MFFKMAAHSKFQRLTYSCYEVGHCWNPSCIGTSLEITKFGLIESFKIYAPIYLVRAILSRRDKEYYKKKLLPEILQSTIFLTANAGLFISGFCIWRKLFGFYFFYNVFACMPLASLAILLERKSRLDPVPVT